MNNTNQLLTNINDYIALTLEGIKKKPETGDTDLLYSVLSVIRDFKGVGKIVRCYKKQFLEAIKTLKKSDYIKV